MTSFRAPCKLSGPSHLMETVRYMEVTRAQLPMGMQKRKMGSKTCQWSPSSRLWVLYSTVQYSASHRRSWVIFRGGQVPQI